MTDPTTLLLALKSAPIWYGVIKAFLSDGVVEAGKGLVEDGMKDGVKEGVKAAFDHLRNAEAKGFNDAFEKATKSFLKRYEFDKEVAQAVISILDHAEKKELRELNHQILTATLFSDKTRIAPIERYCHHVINLDHVAAESIKTHSLTEISRSLRYFFDELQRELLLSEKWRNVVVQFRSLQLQAKIAGEFDSVEMRREYLAYLRDRYQFLDLKGFSPRVSGRELSLRLTEVYTDVWLEEGRPYVSEYAEDELSVMTEKQFFELDWERQLDLLEKRYARLEETKPKVKLLKMPEVLASRKLVILGDPGSGKTTLTGYLVFTLSSCDYSRTGRAVEGILPILVRIADYGRALEKDPTLHLIDYISQELTSDFGPLLRQELDYGQCLVMLDGLDEVAEVGQRQRVAERIENMVATHGRNRFLVTSRPIGYHNAQLTGDFRHVTLRPLTQKEQEKYVHLWYSEIYARGAGKADGGRNGKEPEALIKAFKTKPSVAKLASNPLLLTIIVLMHWRGTKFPDRRVDVYASATETLIENWPLRQRGIDLDLEQVKSILAPVALAILSASVSGVIAERNLVPLLLRIVREVHGGSLAEAQAICDRMLRDLSEHSGIFLERGRDEYDYPVYGFLHQTFGEYLTALALAEQWNIGELKLANYIHKARWREVVLLLTGVIGTQGRAVASNFIAGILAQKSPFEDILHRDLLLVLECLTDDLRIKPLQRKDIIEQGVKLLESEVFDLRSAALTRIKSLKGTDHASVAVELLTQLLEKVKHQPKGLRRDETRLLAAEALCELGESEAAKPIIWEISEDSETFRNIIGQVQGSVTKLKVLYWTNESLEWLANLFCAERRIRPRLIVGSSLAETFIRTADGTDILIFDYLKDDDLTALFDMIYNCVPEEDIRQRVAWARTQKQQSVEPEKLLNLINPQTDRQVSFLAASRLIDIGHEQAGIAAMKRLCSGVDNQAIRAAEVLLGHGESIADLRAVRELAIFSSNLEGAKLARKLAEIGERSLGVSTLLLYVIKGLWPAVEWEAVESLLALGQKDLGIAAARLIAYTPGHAYRYHAAEALLDAQRETGRFDEVIEVLTDLAYDSYGVDQEKAIARLATFRETQQILPILSNALQSDNIQSQYRMAHALVLGGMSGGMDGGDIDAILTRRAGRLKDKNIAFINHRASFLKLAVNFIGNQLPKHSQENILYVIKAIMLHELGEHSSAEDQIRNISNSLAHHSDVNLLVARAWQSWGYPEQAFLYANKALSDTEASSAVKMFSIDIICDIFFEPTSSALINAIKHTHDHEVKLRAIHGLRNSTNSKIVSILMEELHDDFDDPQIRESVIMHLGEAMVSDSKDTLIQALKAESGGVRAAAANACNNLGRIDFVPILLDALGDLDERVRIAASQAIEAIGEPVPAEVLGQALMTDISVEVQRNAAAALSLAKAKEARPYLLQALKNEVDYVREAAVASIQDLEGINAIPLLIGEVKSPTLEPESKANVILSLAKFADQSIAPFFLTVLSDQQPEVSIAAVRALGIQGYNQSAGELAEAAVTGNNEEIVVAATQSLGQLVHESILPALFRNASHSQEAVRKAAAISLTAHGTFGYSVEITQALRDLCLKDASSDVRSAAVTGISWVDPIQAFEILPYALVDENGQVRRAAAQALGILGERTSVSLLNCALYDSDTDVRSAAVQSLGLLGDSDSLDGLYLALQYQLQEVRTQAALALGRIGDITIANTIKNLAYVEPDPRNKQACCLALSYMGKETSAEYLKELRKYGGPPVKATAAECLARLAPETLLETVTDPIAPYPLRANTARLQAQALHFIGESELASKIYDEASADILAAYSNQWSKLGSFFAVIIDSFELGYHSQCVKLLNKAIEFKPREHILYMNLGIVYRIMRQYELSFEMYQKSLGLEPSGSIETSNGFGILYYASGNDKLAIEQFNRSLQLIFKPEWPQPFERYWTDAHDVHMLTIALVGAGYGDIALRRLQNAMPTLIWAPGVVTEILWDIEHLAEVNPSLKKLPELLLLLRVTKKELDEIPRGPLRSSWASDQID